jgi:c-di-GMP-binding flagellar brake protein YcgR
MHGRGRKQAPQRALCLHEAIAQPCANIGSAVERRQSKRKQIEVDIEIAQPGSQRCYGFAGNISRTGISVHLWKGELPSQQRFVILNFKVRTGNETLYRKIYARVVHADQKVVGLEFAEHDFVAEAIVQDLMFYQKHEKREQLRQANATWSSGTAPTVATADQIA